MKLYPIEGKILVQPLEHEFEEPTPAHVGILLLGNVVDLFGNTIPSGTIVVYPAYTGLRVKQDGKLYVIMAPHDIYGAYGEDRSLRTN